MTADDSDVVIKLDGITVMVSEHCAVFPGMTLITTCDCGAYTYVRLADYALLGSHGDYEVWATCACSPGRVRGGRFSSTPGAPLMVVTRDE